MNREKNLAELSINKKYLSENVVLRIRCDAATNADEVFIDNIEIQICDKIDEVTTSFENLIVEEDFDIETTEDILTVYPNPTVDYIFLKNTNSAYPEFDVYIFTLDGTQVFHSQFSVDDEVKIDVTALHGSTQYLVRVVSAQSITPVNSTFFKV